MSLQAYCCAGIDIVDARQERACTEWGWYVRQLWTLKIEPHTFTGRAPQTHPRFVPMTTVGVKGLWMATAYIYGI